MLVDRVKVMGRQGIPLTATAITDYVADIVGHAVGESWVRCFKACHPELKVKWSSTLEKCCAASLNPTLVNEFYNLLEVRIRMGWAYLHGLWVRVLTGTGTGHAWHTRGPIPLPVTKRRRGLNFYIATIISNYYLCKITLTN